MAQPNSYSDKSNTSRSRRLNVDNKNSAYNNPKPGTSQIKSKFGMILIGQTEI